MLINATLNGILLTTYCLVVIGRTIIRRGQRVMCTVAGSSEGPGTASRADEPLTPRLFDLRIDNGERRPLRWRGRWALTGAWKWRMPMGKARDWPVVEASKQICDAAAACRWWRPPSRSVMQQQLAGGGGHQADL